MKENMDLLFGSKNFGKDMVLDGNDIALMHVELLLSGHCGRRRFQIE